jgi:endonuclease/exonuclease/phosphatase family metal-dependent hydrolase
VTVYNVHLESRGDERLSFVQLIPALNDAAKSAARCPALIPGDLNRHLRARRHCTYRGKGFPESLSGLPPADQAGSHSVRKGAIDDWAVVLGPVGVVPGQVHKSVNASDHYPLTFTLQREHAG